MRKPGTSLLTLRVPDNWKSRWSDEAAERGIPISQLVKERAIAASAGSSMLSVKIGGQQVPVDVVRLDNIKMEEGLFDDQK